jgi:hypothetical protein
MVDSIAISKTLSIRDCGHDEFWLQDQLYENPTILGLGDLVVLRREQRQSKGGRLDLLLQDPEDDTYYEVEVMLGATDESHIIRTIEYWDLEKRRFPNRKHVAVLVAESITRRFFNVVHLLSLSIPMVGIQANLIDADGKRALHFVKVVDLFEDAEEEPEGRGEVYNEDWWKTNAPWTIENAQSLVKALEKVFPKVELRFVKSYVSLLIDNDMYFWFYKRTRGNKSWLNFWVDGNLLPRVAEILDTKNIPYSSGKYFKLSVDRKFIDDNAELFARIGELVKQSWQDQKS